MNKLETISTEEGTPLVRCHDLRGSDTVSRLVSIIIPAYNAAETLPRCVRSVLQQTYRAIEIIVIDDGSSDGTLDVANNLASRHSEIHVVRQENKGLSGARNTGIELSQGELLFFLDADDYIEPDEIEALCSEMGATGADIVVGGIAYEMPDGTRDKILTLMPGVTDEEGYWHQAYAESSGNYVSYVVSCGKIFKRESFRDVRFDEGKLHEDEFIIHRLVAQCSKIAFSDTAGYVYVQNQGSIMHSPSVKSCLDGAEAFAMRTAYFIDRGWWKYAWRTLIDGRCRLADAAYFEKNESERARLEQLISVWRKNYSQLRIESSGNGRTKFACCLFLISPKLFSRLNRIWMNK